MRGKEREGDGERDRQTDRERQRQRQRQRDRQRQRTTVFIAVTVLEFPTKLHGSVLMPSPPPLKLINVSDFQQLHFLDLFATMLTSIS